MPWNTADVDSHSKGLTDQQKKVWVKVANSALARCEEKGGKDCEGSAIRQANKVAKQVAEGERVFFEAEMSHQDIADALRSAIRAVSPSGDGYYCWVRDVFEDAVVYEQETPEGVADYRRAYTMDAEGKVTLGEPVKVQRQTVYVPVGEAARLQGLSGQIQTDIIGALVRAGYDPAAILETLGLPPIKHLGLPPVTVQGGGTALAGRTVEAADIDLDSDLVPLAERSIRADGTAAIKIIQPGWGSSGFYGADILERDGPKVFKAGTQMYIDHPTVSEESDRPERSLRDLAGELVTDARWEADGAAGAGLYADAQVFKPWQPVIEELAPHIGTSIRALGKTEKGEAEGKTGPIVTQLVAAKSVDYVTAPGAGGKVLQLIESARNSIAQGGRKKEDKGMDQLEEVTKARDDALAKITELEKAGETSDAELKRLREVILLREAGDVAREALAKTDLPAVTQARLCEALAKAPPIKEGALDKEAFTTAIDEAAKAELAYLAEVVGAGRIRGMGGNGGGPDDHKTLEESWRHMHPDWTDAQIKTALDGR